MATEANATIPPMSARPSKEEEIAFIEAVARETLAANPLSTTEA